MAVFKPGSTYVCNFIAASAGGAAADADSLPVATAMGVGRMLGKGRKVILLGPQAQAAIRPFLTRDLQAYCFSPLEARRERFAACPTHRHQPVEEPATGRRIRDCWDEKNYAQCIRRVCDELGIPRWSPNQLRHNALTRLGNQFGDDLARIVAGHASIDTTEIYLERELDKASAVVGRVG